MSNIAEFDLIQKYFTPENRRKDVTLGIGDDCALLTPPAGKQLALTTDTLVAGVHFPEQTSPRDIAYKSVAVSLSDIAAMGAEPAWVMLALTLPEIEEEWVKAFASSLADTITEYNVQLVGGDTTQGPLSITIQATGFIDPSLVMRRDAAKPGDRIYVTGTLGDAALGLKLLSDGYTVNPDIVANCMRRLNRPSPRVNLGMAAAEFCRCAIDVSDGLLADMTHILTASLCGAVIELDKLPESEAFHTYFSQPPNNETHARQELMLSGGDDYELCITVPTDQESRLIELAESMGISLSCIGRIIDGSGIQLVDSRGETVKIQGTGYQHFTN